MIDRIKQVILSGDPALHIKDMAKPGVLAFSLIFILLPWVPAGSEGSMSGAATVGYLLTSEESGAWLKDNPAGTMFIMVAIPATIFLCFVSFYRAIIGNRHRHCALSLYTQFTCAGQQFERTNVNIVIRLYMYAPYC